MKKTTLFISVVLMFFLILGAASAAEIDNVTSTETSNLISDENDFSLEDSKLNSDTILKSTDEGNSADDNLKSIVNNENRLTANDTSIETNQSGAANITKVSTTLKVNNAHYSKTNTIFKVILSDNNGTSLSGKSVTLTLNGKSYKNTTNDNGIAYIAAPSLSKGTYTVKAQFNGDSQYLKSTFSDKVKVYTSIGDRTDLVKTYGNKIVYTATFWNNNAKLNNSNVKFTVNGKTYTVKTNETGKASLTITGLLPGKYTIKSYNPYSKETTSNTITVNKAKTTVTGSNAYILPKTKYTYSVVLKDNKDKAIKNAKVHFTYNYKKVTVTTDANGKAKVSIPALSKGTYTISYKYTGNAKFKGCSGSYKLYVKDSTTTLKSSALKMQYNDGSSFSVKATDANGKALANKNVKFTIDGKTTTVKTDGSGVAKLAIGNLKPNTYNVTIKFSTAGLKDYNTQTNTVTITQQTVTVTANNLVMKYNDGTNYTATVKNKTGSAIPRVVVEFTLNGETSKIKTDENGVASLPVKENVGYYPIKVNLGENLYYTSSKLTKHILVNGTKFKASDLTMNVNSTKTFEVKLIDGQDKAVIGKTVKFTLNSKESSVQTDANGIAKIDVPQLVKGTYTVTYTDGSATGSSKINVVDTVTLKEVIAASQNVKKYIENNEKLPETVTIGGMTYTTAEYLYLASQAIINLNANNKKDINVKSVNSPTNPQKSENLGNLYDYLSVAKNVVNTANSKGTMPNSVSSNLGTIGYEGLVYATARVVAFYQDYSMLPNYVSIKSIDTSLSSSLNVKNTITNLKAYLAASTNCQVGNSKIKSLVDSLTSGLTTEKAKATAIYNYVRDKISYSFYYDTKYGAVGTLNAKTGNCVDEAHLLVAMYRTAGLAARYVHGTCKFSSGNTYGHVWTQVLIGNTWVVGDPTSTRNSFGNVVNWNNNNYNLKGYYASIAF